jgi:beta-lactam-binding protein with PASTA domain
MTPLEERHSWLSDCWAFLKSKRLWTHLLVLGILSFLILWGVFLWLDHFTRHGQKLLIPDYIEKPIELATADADDRSFEIVITDSVFFVGEEGGIIKRQNPKPGSKAKEGRKIYVTVTKYQAEMVSISALPPLYGEDYEIKSRELAVGFDLKTDIIDETFDPGPEGHIMKVLHKGQLIVSEEHRNDSYEIERGGKLSVIVSKSSGGLIEVPDLRCKTLQEARFQLSALQLSLGEIELIGATDNMDQAYVTDQAPFPQTEEGAAKVERGSSMNLWISPIRPSYCDSLKTE